MFNGNCISEHYNLEKNWKKDQYFQKYSKEKEDKRLSQTGFLKKRKKGPAGVAQ